MAEWYVYALLTMLLFSFANITLKTLLTDQLVEQVKKNSGIILPTILIFVLATVAVYFLFLTKLNLPLNIILTAIGFVIMAMAGFVFLLMATSSGPISLVTAIVSTSSLTVALLSVFLLKEQLSLKEIGGIALAFIGILMIIWK
ncbi:MAG: EamA family transporter [Candidatus Micrarchaeota archaeon]